MRSDSQSSLRPLGFGSKLFHLESGGRRENIYEEGKKKDEEKVKNPMNSKVCTRVRTSDELIKRNQFRLAH